jgi:hypothetical protein
MRAAAVCQSNAEDRRDASYVRVCPTPLFSPFSNFLTLIHTISQYELYVDKFAKQKRKKPQLELKTFYGQIQHIILIRLPATQDLRLIKPETVILASIKNCAIKYSNDLDMHFYQSEEGYTELVDIATVQCLVGRVFDRGWWTVIDRSGKLARASAEVFEE